MIDATGFEVAAGLGLLGLGFFLGILFAGWWADRDFKKRFPISTDHTDTTLE